VPGQLGSPRLVLAHGGELIANLQQQTPDLVNAAAGAGIPGVRGGASSGGGQPIHVEVLLGTDTQNQLFVNGAKSNAGYKVMVQQQGKADNFDRRSTSF
jgi:hypothetical protein